MRLRIEEITLVGTSRTIRFEPGMNAIVGSMSGGKTATVSCLRALLGADVSVVPELRGRTIAGTVLVGDRRFRIVRPLVTTANAMVEIAEVDGRGEVWRLPASQLQAGYDETFRDWWRNVLRLPRLRVPRAPNDDRSPLVPVTISDYLMYCVLRQKEIDSSVFGTPDNYSKNIKRKYVFEILYGLYDPEAAGLRDRLREVTTELAARSLERIRVQRIVGKVLELHSGRMLSARIDGLTNAEIAARMGVGTATVKTHVASALAKTGARDRPQAVIAVYELGFITPG
ncbi:LuxR C-terminal-related transcriptional regulator [Streptomyces sp. NPDC057582]|uniref:LuxR C-terminal-related transcriptional regulator n=1 Tax=Streptomyces sp. NPDC057582 TaxID=3346174 RepID=UPI0036900C90